MRKIYMRYGYIKKIGLDNKIPYKFIPDEYKLLYTIDSLPEFYSYINMDYSSRNNEMVYELPEVLEIHSPKTGHIRKFGIDNFEVEDLDWTPRPHNLFFEYSSIESGKIPTVRVNVVIDKSITGVVPLDYSDIKISL